MMTIKHLTTSQMQAVLYSRGVALPAETQPLDFYQKAAAANGLVEVPLSELAALKATPARHVPPPSTSSGVSARLEVMLLHRRDHLLLRAFGVWQLNAQAARH